MNEILVILILVLGVNIALADPEFIQHGQLDFVIPIANINHADGEVHFSYRVIPNPHTFSGHPWSQGEGRRLDRWGFTRDDQFQNRTLIVAKFAFVVKNKRPEFFSFETLTNPAYVRSVSEEVEVEASQANCHKISCAKNYGFLNWSSRIETDSYLFMTPKEQLSSSEFARYFASLDANLADELYVGELYSIAASTVKKGGTNDPLSFSVTKFYPYASRNTLIVRYLMIAIPLDSPELLDAPDFIRDSIRENLPEYAVENAQEGITFMLAALQDINEASFLPRQEIASSSTENRSEDYSDVSLGDAS